MAKNKVLKTDDLGHDLHSVQAWRGITMPLEIWCVELKQRELR